MKRIHGLLLGLLVMSPGFAAEPLVDPKDMARVNEGVRLLSGVLQSTRQDQAMSSLERQRWTYGVIEHPRIDGALATMMQRLRAAAGAGAPEARVHITPDPAFQAFAAEDGAIFIAAGMLRSMESEDEVAALLAHEYVHVLRRHAGRTALQNAQGAAAGISALYLERAHGRGASEAHDPSTEFMRQALLRETAMRTVQSGIVPTRARSQEDQADREGVDLLVTAGDNPVGMVDLLGRMDAWETQRKQTAVSTPDAAPRGIGATLTRYLQRSDQARSAGRKVDEPELVGGLIASLVGGAQRGLDRTGRSHRDAGQRVELILEHIGTHHADAARPDMRPVSWKGDAAAGDLFASLDQLHALLGDNSARLTRAGREESAALSAIARTPAGRTSLGRYISLRYLAANTRNDAGLAALQQELTRPDSLFVAHQLVLELMSQSGDREAALQTLDLSRSSFGDPPELLPYGVRLHRRAGNADAAALYAARCAGSGNAHIQRRCEEER